LGNQRGVGACIKYILVLCGYLFCCAVDAQPTWLILEGSESHDFGAVHQGQLLRHQFVFVNQSSREVCAKVTKRSCACTTAELSSGRVPPGQRCTLDIAVDTTWPPTEQMKIMVRADSWPSTDETQVTSLALELKAAIELAVMVKPTMLKLSGDRDEELTGFFLVQRQSGTPMKLSSPSCDDKRVNVTLNDKAATTS